MAIILDHQFREQLPRTDAGFPISFFHDELAQLPNWSGPLHWHPEFEIATAQDSILDLQVGRDHLLLDPGDSVFINGNVPHSIRQPGGSAPDPMPNIVFDGALVAAENSIIYTRYIQPVRTCGTLSCVLFRRSDESCGLVHSAIREIYRCFADRGPCYEMTVQRDLSVVFEYLTVHHDSLCRVEASRVELSTQIRMQQMLSFIHAHYAEDIALNDIARAASISRSEAGRCFNAYMGCSPIDALIQYRLRMARIMLREGTGPLIEVALACGFHSVNYFGRQFRRYYGCTPGQIRFPGKSCC